MAHVTRKHGNRGEHGNVASMAIQSHWSGNRVRKTKVLGRGCLVYGLILGGCLLYSLSGSEEEKGGFMGGGLHMFRCQINRSFRRAKMTDGNNFQKIIFSMQST